MFALIGNFDFSEVIVVAAAALMLFGKRLPEVAMRAATQFMKMRRAVSKMWREAGLEDELRRVRREVESSVPKFQAPHSAVKEATRRYMRDLEQEVKADPVPSRPPQSHGAGQGSLPRNNPALEKARAHPGFGQPGSSSTASDPSQESLLRGPDPEPKPPATGSQSPPHYDPLPVPREALEVDDRREGGAAPPEPSAAEPASAPRTNSAEPEGPGAEEDRETA